MGWEIKGSSLKSFEYCVGWKTNEYNMEENNL